MRIPAGAKPGLAPGQGALGLRLVRWSRGADAGACRCWPASAGGGVANRRRMPRIAVTGLRLGTALKQVFILEFDTMRVLGGSLYAWEDGYQPGPNQAESGLCEYDGGHI